MSKKSYCNQYKLNQILEQVEVLSDVVDELRTELNHLKKISFNVNHKNICFESIKENKDYISASLLQKVCKSSNHCTKKRDQGPIATKFSVMYGLKYFKNKIIKNIENIRKIQQSSKNTKNKCMTLSQQHQETCFLQEKEIQASLNISKNIIKYINNERSSNSIDTSFRSDISTQTETVVCSQESNERKLDTCNRLANRDVMIDSVQNNPLSSINNDRSMIYLNRFAELSKNRVKQMFLKNKIKKCRKCSCMERCPYALNKLPCNRYKCSTPKQKVNDEINGLMLECINFKEKNNFPKFIRINTVQNGKCATNSSPLEVGLNKSSISSLSLDLKFNTCSNYCDSKRLSKFIK
ncbi:uncharacterized protein LOC105426993 [Pogonomyrmex barbatus]|uniref:Uncharacterized protein LOC105426993 n=1 Tax=Pogonomyrmex barbatus TaxID=144034 RepID=A0A6I9W5I7_9HYME|nr:uncharacterized protein LOC105426993 [Pogonomyrmex barbatus]